MRYANAVLNTRGIRREVVRGKRYLVAPVTLIRSGVLNGSAGALYYPPEEVCRRVPAWAGVPLTIGHPTINGELVSAKTPGVEERQAIGFVANPRCGAGKLSAEAWIDEQKAQGLDGRIVPTLERGNPIEVSTGLFTDNEPAANGANHRGERYAFIARNYRPDHLAILPDEVGACSVQDGCGLLVNSDDRLDDVLEMPTMNHEGAITPAGPGHEWISILAEDDEETYRENQRRLGLASNADDDLLIPPTPDYDGIGDDAGEPAVEDDVLPLPWHR